MKQVKLFFVEWVNCTWKLSSTVWSVNLRWRSTKVRLRLPTKKRLLNQLNTRKFTRNRPVVVVSLPISYLKSDHANWALRISQVLNLRTILLVVLFHANSFLLCRKVLNNLWQMDLLQDIRSIQWKFVCIMVLTMMLTRIHCHLNWQLVLASKKLHVNVRLNY